MQGCYGMPVIECCTTSGPRTTQEKSTRNMTYEIMCLANYSPVSLCVTFVFFWI